MEAEKRDFYIDGMVDKPSGSELNLDISKKELFHRISDLESRLGKALDDFAEAVKERDRLKEALGNIKNLEFQSYYDKCAVVDYYNNNTPNVGTSVSYMIYP